jgi:LysR family transcriptional regulator, low CO2-responsive transcriptional regulator
MPTNSREPRNKDASVPPARLMNTRITLQKLAVFRSVSRHSSVTRAAEEMGMAQPAVTAHLRGLERKLGVRLVRKVGRNISLTEAGEHVYRWADEIVARSLDLRRDVTALVEGSSGNVTLCASMAVGSYVLGEVIPRFYSQYPRSRITTKISNPRLAIEAVRAGECDLAVLILDPQLQTDDLVLERLWTERLLLVAAPASRLVGKQVSPEELLQVPFITPPRGLVARDLEDAALGAAGIIRGNVVLEFGHPEPIKAAVRADIGLSLQLETAVQDDIRRGLLRAVSIRGVQLFQPIYLAHRRGKLFTPMQQQLVEYLRHTNPRGLLRSKR